MDSVGYGIQPQVLNLISSGQDIVSGTSFYHLFRILYQELVSIL